jgi:hypothetical protein
VLARGKEEGDREENEEEGKGGGKSARATFEDARGAGHG